MNINDVKRMILIKYKFYVRSINAINDVKRMIGLKYDINNKS
jgi:ribosomal protein L33